MFTDIVGYSAMVGKDEEKALSLLDEHNKIIFPIIKSNSGTIIKLIGDAIFARFPSSSNSVNTATKIQSILEERNSISQKDNIIQIRIGLHFGSVIEKDDDLFGHDVNVCSRIESLSPKGSIAASSELINSLDKSFDIFSREMGYIKLKNIATPHQIYKIYNNANDYESENDKQLQKNLKHNGIEIIDINSYDIEEIFSVAVLYITNLGSEEDESISYTLTENLIDDLGYINSIRIPVFNEIVKYKNTELQNDDLARKLQINNVLEGSILKENNKIKLNFQLISIESGKVLWNDKWTDNVNNAKSIRKHIMDGILNEFGLDYPQKLIKYFSEEMSNIPEAIEEYNAGKYCMDCLETNDDIEKAKTHFEKAIQFDKDFVESYYMLSMSNKRLGYFEDAETALNEGEEIAEEQDNIHGLSYIYRGYKNLYTSWGKYDKAKIYIVKALKTHMKLSHPNFETFLRLDYASCLNNIYQPELSIEQNNLAIELLKKIENNRYLGIAYGYLNQTYLTMGDYTKSIEFGKKGLSIFRKEEIINNTAVMLIFLAETYFRTGMYQEMHKCILEAEEILSGLDDYFRQAKINFFKAHYYLHKKDHTTSLQYMEKSIENFNLSQNIAFETNAHIEKLYILVETNATQQIDATTSKIDSLTKQVKGAIKNYNYEGIKYLILAKNGDSNKESLDKLKNTLDDQKENWGIFNFFLAYWSIAKAYHVIDELEISKECHEKAKSIIKIHSDKISGKLEKDSFNQSYINQLVMEDIKIKVVETKKISEEEQSIFAFCPSCGFNNENKFAFCPSCGNSLKQ